MTSITTAAPNCPGCSTESNFQGELPAAYAFAGQAQGEPIAGGGLFECPQCSLKFRWPTPTKAEHDQKHAEGNINQWQNEVKRRRDWQLTKEFFEKHPNRKSVLDVGCFDGQFLRYLGDDYARFGVEVHSGAAERARSFGIDIIAADFAELTAIDQQFDFTVNMDVIEHTHDPLGFLQLLSDCTAEGGFVIVSTGNSEAPTWKFMGTRYWYCANAEHLSFINPSWCEFAARKLGLSLETVIRFSHADLNQTLKQTAFFTRQGAANVVFKYLPQVWGRLRPANGCYGPRSLKERCESPPPWTSAKDHIFVAFKKA